MYTGPSMGYWQPPSQIANLVLGYSKLLGGRELS